MRPSGLARLAGAGLAAALLFSIPGAGRASPLLYFVHTDHLNTPRLIADQNQATVWRWEQVEPFGDNPPLEDPDGNSVIFHMPFRFPGQYFDKETNLHYNYFRDYNPNIGRYLESDPVGLYGGPNTYSYANASPLSRKDLIGLWDEGPGGGGDGQGVPAGPCRLIQEIGLYTLPPLIILPRKCALCVYRCSTLSCPPKVWHLVKFMCTPYGCVDTWPPSQPVTEPVN